MKNLAGVILAGGKNLRMKGKNKAFIKIGGKPIIQKILKIFKKNFEEILIVTNIPKDYKLYEQDAVIIEDMIKGIGPLGGIYSALSYTFKEAVFIVACDMPFLHNAFVEDAIEYFYKINCDVLVPKIKTSIEPLCAIYKKRIKEQIYSFIKKDKDYSMRKFLQTVNVCYWNVENNYLFRKNFTNINTYKDLKKINK